MKIIIPILLILFTSCSTVSKIKSAQKTTVENNSSVKVDSAKTTVIDSSKLVKDNTLTVKESKGDWEKETVIEFDTSTHIPFFIKKGVDSFRIGNGNAPLNTIDPADYFPSQPVRKITIKEKGKLVSKETTQAAKVDSSVNKSTETTSLKKEANTEEKKTEVASNSQVKRSKFLSMWWLLLLLLPAGYFANKRFGWV